MEVWTRCFSINQSMFPPFGLIDPVHKLMLHGQGGILCVRYKAETMNEIGASTQHSAFCTSSSLKSWFRFLRPTSPALTACSCDPTAGEAETRGCLSLPGHYCSQRGVIQASNRPAFKMSSTRTRHQPLSSI